MDRDPSDRDDDMAELSPPELSAPELSARQLGAPAPLRHGARRAISFALVGLVLVLAVAGAFVPSLWPGTLAGREAGALAAGVIFAASYLALALGKIPVLAIDRAGVALVGACLMVAAGALPLDGRVPCRRSRHDHPAARHDDRGRQFAPVRFLRAGDRVGWRARARRCCCWRRWRRCPACSRPSWSTTRSASCCRRWCWT